MAEALRSPAHPAPIVGLDRIVTLVDGLDHPEGVAYGPDGYLYAGGEAGQIYRISLAGQVEQIASTGGFILGLALDAQQNVYACDSERRQVVHLSQAGQIRVLSAGTPQTPLRNPNFPAFDSQGHLYVTDSGDWLRDNGRILCIDPDGRTTVASESAHRFPNGLALSASGRWLYVAESTWPGVSRLAVGVDGTLGAWEEVVTLPGTVPDGLAFDSAGNLYISCYRPDRIYRLSPQGVLDIWADDPAGTALAAPTNLAFAGPELNQLVVANLGRWHLAAIAVETPGLPVSRPHVGGA